MEVTREAARTAAQWWGDRLHTDTHHDNGDNSMTGFFTQMLADRLNEVVEDSAREKFVEILTERILDEHKKNGRISSFCLTCDYGPSRMLAEAAQEAGISTNNFPWKTHMGFREEDDGSTAIYASSGYRAPWNRIWPAEEVE